MLAFLRAFLFFSFLILPNIALGIGFGEIKLHSYLNEPLDADIELLGTESYDVERLLVSLASAQEFKRAGVERPFFLSQLRFEVNRKAAHTFIRISSRDPIKQPYLDFLIDLTWPGGRLVRGYTLLLDPAPTSGNLHERRSRYDPQLEDGKSLVLSPNGMPMEGPQSKQAFETLFEPEPKLKVSPLPPAMTVVSNDAANTASEDGTETSQISHGNIDAKSNSSNEESFGAFGVVRRRSDVNAAGPHSRTNGSNGQELRNSPNSSNTSNTPPISITAPLPTISPHTIFQVHFNTKQIVVIGSLIILFVTMVSLAFLLRYLSRKKQGTSGEHQLNPGFASTNANYTMYPMMDVRTHSAPMHAVTETPLSPVTQAPPVNVGNINALLNNIANKIGAKLTSSVTSSVTPSVASKPSETSPMSVSLISDISDTEFLNNEKLNNEINTVLRPLVSEIVMKLELAQSYFDLGDKEQAKSLLNDVILEGNEQEKEKAHRLLYDFGIEKMG